MVKHLGQDFQITRRRLLGGVAGGIAGSVISLAAPGLGGVALAAPNADAPHDDDVIGYLYVNDNTAGSNTVAGFARRANGNLTPLAGSPFMIGGAGNGGALPSQGAIQATWEKRHLLAVDAGSNQISLAKIRSNGSLQAVGSPVSSNGNKPVSITLHKDLVYVANAGDGGANYTGFILHDDGDGYLVPLAGSTVPVPDGAGIGQVLIDPSGKRLIGVRVETSVIDSFVVGGNGKLMAAPGSPFAAQAAGPFGSAFRPDTWPDQLFVTNAHAGPGNGTVSAFKVGENGSLTPVDGSPYADMQTAPCWAALSPDGKYLFAANTGSNSISRYRIAPSGALSLLDSTPPRGGSGLGLFDLALDPSGKFLYQLEGGKQKIGVFAVKGGNLTELPASPFDLPAGSSPWGIAII